MAGRRAPGSLSAVQPPTAATLWRALVTLVLGLLAATLGTVMHRAVRPWGLLLCVLLVLVVVLTCRAWVGWYGFVAGAGGVLLGVQVLAGGGPGGDVLVPGDDAWGWLWALGCVAAVVVAGLVPRRWVQDDGPAGS